MIIRALRASIAGIIVYMLTGTPAWAQLNFGDADLRELSQYKLTMERVSSLTAALKALNRLAQTDPIALKNFLATEEKTIGASVKRIESDMVVAGALKSAGVTAREYVVGSIALAQAYNVVELKKMGASYSGQLKIPDENVAFVELHPDEIAAVMAEIDKFAQSAGN